MRFMRSEEGETMNSSEMAKANWNQAFCEGKEFAVFNFNTKTSSWGKHD